MSCSPPDLFDLAAGRLDAARTRAVRAHVQNCPSCRADLDAAERITAHTAGMQRRIDDASSERLWQSVAAAAEQASLRARKKSAWRELLGSRAVDLAERLWPADQRWQGWLARAAALVALAIGSAALLNAPPMRTSAAANPAGAGTGAAPLLGPDVGAAATGAAGEASQPSAVAQGALAATVDPADQPENAVLTAVSPPRGIYPTTAVAPASTSAVTAALAAGAATIPTVAPRHARGWHHAATAAAGPAGAPAQALLACGAVVDLAEAKATLMHNQPNAAEIELESGRVVVRVPKLPPGGSLRVRTDDALVEVKGTAFAVDKRNREFTTVDVFEGVVQVSAAGGGREPQWGRETFLVHAGESRRIEGLEAFLRRQLAELDEALASSRLAAALEIAQRYLTVAGPDGPEIEDVQLRLGAILSRTGRSAEAARLYRSVADGDGPVYARQNALAVLGVLYRDADRAEAERAAWVEYLARFPDGLYAREALIRQVELACGRVDGAKSDGAQFEASADQARRLLLARFGGEPSVVAILERCKGRQSQ